MLIKFYNQITEVNHTLLMRILLYCNWHNLLAIQCFGLQPLKIPLQESLGRQWHCGSCSYWHQYGLGGFAIAASGRDRGAAMAPRAENLWQILQSLKFIFLYFIKINYDVLKFIIYIINFVLKFIIYILKKYNIYFFKINKIRCPEKMLSTNALK